MNGQAKTTRLTRRTRKGSLLDKIYSRIKRSKDLAFVYKDFHKYTKDSSQIAKTLSKLVAANVLLRLGCGVYAKATLSKISGACIPEGGLRAASIQALKKLGIDLGPTAEEVAYNTGKSTQVPTGRVLGVKKKITRRLSHNGISIKYQKIKET